MVLSPREMRHDVHLEQLALLGLTTLLEVYSVVLWLFFVTFDNKEMIPPNISFNIKLGKGFVTFYKKIYSVNVFLGYFPPIIH